MAENRPDAVERMFDDTRRAGPTPLANQLQAVARIVLRSALRRYPKELDLSFVHAAVIGGIGTFGPIAARDLATLLTMHEGQLSRTMGELVEKGWVDRMADPADSRRKMLMLTKAGKRLYRQVIAVQDRREERFLSGISNEDWENFLATLSRIRSNAEAVLADEAAEK